MRKFSRTLWCVTATVLTNASSVAAVSSTAQAQKRSGHSRNNEEIQEALENVGRERKAHDNADIQRGLGDIKPTLGFNKPNHVSIHLEPTDEILDFDLQSTRLIPIDFTNFVPQVGGEVVTFERNLYGTASYYDHFGAQPQNFDIIGRLTGRCTILHGQLGADASFTDLTNHCNVFLSYMEDLDCVFPNERHRTRTTDCRPIYGEATATGNIMLRYEFGLQSLVQTVGNFLVTGSSFDLGGAFNGGFLSFKFSPSTGWILDLKVPFTQEASCKLQEYVKEDSDFLG